MARDYYEILGVSKNATAEELKKAYRTMAHKYHPDKSGGDEAKFKEVNEAYQTLSNTDKRSRYDQFGHAGSQAGFGGGAPGGGAGGFQWEDVMRQAGGGFQGGGAEDIGDIFGDLFGFGRGGGRQQQQSEHAGRSLQMTMTLDFKDAVFGATKSIQIELHERCSVCAGNGSKPGTKMKKCNTCKGSGQVVHMQRTILGSMQTQRVCPTCHGAGEIPEALCTHCKGTGRERMTKEIDVSIPAGIDDGQTLRVSGKGDAGQRGAPAGDLLITVRVRPDTRFRRDGEDIHTRLGIKPADAVLGTSVDVETVDGPVELKIPHGTQSGKLFRLRDRGVPSLRSRGRGDHIVEVIVQIPEKLSGKAKKLYEQLRDAE